MLLTRQEKLKWSITVLIPLLLFLIPETEAYNYNIKMFIVITSFFLFIIGFEFFDILVPALLLPTAWLIFQVAPAQVVFAPWTTTTVFMILGAYFLASVLGASGLLRRSSYWIMSKVGASWVKMLFGLFFAGLLANFLTFGGAYILMAALCFGFCQALGLKVGKASAGIAAACFLGTCSSKCFLYSPAFYGILIPMAKTGTKLEGQEFTITFMQAIGHNLPMFFVSVVTLWVLAKLYQPEEEIQGVEYFKNELQQMGKMSKEEKKCLFILLATTIFLVTVPLHKLDSAYGFMIFPWLMVFPGFSGEASKRAIKEVNFGMVAFIASCMGIGVVATKLGIGAIIKNVVSPHMVGGSYFAFFGILYLLVFFLNFLMTPLAIFALLTAPMINIAGTMGIEPLPIIYVLIHCSEAIILPYEYVPYLVVYSFGFISMKDFIKINTIRSIFWIAGVMIVLIPYWKIIGLI